MYKSYNKERIKKAESYDYIIQRIKEEVGELQNEIDPINRFIEAGDVLLQIARLIYKLEQATGYNYKTILQGSVIKYESRDKINKNKDYEKLLIDKFLKELQEKTKNKLKTLKKSKVKSV